ncbi:hypothetical protein [Aquipuribacter nitratireducens]|uniref:Glycosyl hydrolase family 67 C-terminal domain-containing protein n=1 Tax=Aquipuribacter nitratireducens TaxID=650104 RepID=A0ABW0GQB2_9MICO
MRGGGGARAAAAVVAVALVVGVVAAAGVDRFLAVSFADKDPLVAAARSPLDVEPVAPLGTVAVAPLPAGHEDDPLLTLARTALATAIEDRDGTTAGTTAAAGARADATVTLALEGEVPDGADPAVHTVARDGSTVALAAPDRRGLAQAMFRLADRFAAGEDLADVAPGPTRVAPALDRRFVDTGAVGVVPDPAAYAAQDDYVHASGALGEAVLPAEPWLDPNALDRVDAQWRAYVDRMVAYGYDGVVVPGFLEYVTFAGVGDGHAVYPAGSPYVGRAEAMRAQVGAMWAYADTMGMDVVMVTDMLALTEPLEAYLEAQPGGLDADSVRLWDVYAAGLDELLREMPFVDGLMIRVGEAGAVYNLDGWDYYSALEVTTDAQVRAMLHTFGDVTAAHDADLFLRSWSVGVGEVGDLHTNPDTYERVLGDGSLDDVVVSTKFVAGDFDSWLPLNPTLLAGDQDRLVEIQARREFEAFSAFPNDTTGDHAAALRQVAAADAGLDGVWVWTQGGGPQRAGPMSLYLTTGWWEPYDLQVWTSAQLAWDPQADVDALERGWLRRTWSEEPETVAALSGVLARSRAAVLDGLYVRTFAEQEVRAFGLEPPPMLWVFKWDLVSGDTATWAAISQSSRGRVGEALAAGDRAVATVDGMRADVAALDPATFRDPRQHAQLRRSLDYERDLFVTLDAYREAMLLRHEHLATGSADTLARAEAAAARYRVLADAHETRWTGDLDFPPYELAAADRGLDRLEARTASVWGARLLLVLVGLAVALLRPLRRAALLPWRLDPATWGAAGPTTRAATLAVPLAVVTGAHAAFGSWSSPLWTALAVTTALAGVGTAALMSVARRRWDATGRTPGSRTWPSPGLVVASVAGPQLVGVVPLLVAVAWRGPVGAWTGFWLDPTARSAYVVALVVVLVWVLLAPALAATTGRWGAGAVAAAAAGGLLVWPGLLGVLAGTERALTALNDELQVVPAGLSRILGITVHLGIPTALPVAVLAAGTVLLAVAVGLLLLAGRRAAVGAGRPAAPQPSTASATVSHSAST